MGAFIRDGYLYFQINEEVEMHLHLLFPSTPIFAVAILKNGDDWGPWLRDMGVEEHAEEVTEGKYWNRYSDQTVSVEQLGAGIIVRRRLQEPVFEKSVFKKSVFKKSTRYQILKGIV